MLVLFGVAAALAGLTGMGATRPANRTALITFAVVGSPPGGLCVVRPDGSRRLRLTRGDDRTPSWSPDGRYVAFSRRLGERSLIHVADARGQTVRRFGRGPVNDDPAWSPDGQSIAYSAGVGRSSRIVVASASGEVVHELHTRGGFASRPAWSPDSKRIAYVQQPDSDVANEGAPSRILVASADGSSQRVLVGSAGDPAWRPGGAEIAYIAYGSRFAESGSVVVADADGRNPRRVTDARRFHSRPAWSPGGKLLAFARGSRAGSTIVVAARDGSGERVAVKSSSYGAVDPAWRPRAVLPATMRVAC